MEKFNQHLIKFVKYYSPIVIVAITMTIFGFSSESNDKSLTSYLFNIAGWIGMAWCLAVVYLFFSIALNENLKNSFVRWLAGIRENDERETYLTGVASKKTFITVTSILVLLLFLSMLQVSIYRPKEEKQTSDSNGQIAIGMGLPLLSNTKTLPASNEQNRAYIVNYQGIPLTSGATLLLIIVLQLGAFYYYSRRENQESGT